jgi:putative nucleotidyltransferase with HDIG domain
MSRLFEAILAEALALESPVNVRFAQQLELIQDSAKRSKVADLLRRADVRNIKEPASSTNKYHPQWARGEYGLSRHVKAVVAFVVDFCDAFKELNQDDMVIAALVHDIMKYEGYNKYTTKDHAAKGADLLDQAGLPDCARMVRSHMGRWDAERGKAPFPEKFDEKMLHLADYLASRKYITVDFDKDDNIVKNKEDSDDVKVSRERLDHLEGIELNQKMLNGEEDVIF